MSQLYTVLCRENADKIRAAGGMKTVRERAMLSWGNGIPGGDKPQVTGLQAGAPWQVGGTVSRPVWMEWGRGEQEKGSENERVGGP